MYSLKFGNCFTLLLVLLTSIFVFGSPSSAQVVERRPDIKAFPAYDLAIVTTSVGGKNLVFSTRTWNSGTGPLELRPGGLDSIGRKVYQRVFRSDGTSYDNYAGSFVYHADHGHFHFENYADYILQPVNAPGASQRTGSKTTFCIIDTDAINTSLPGALQQAVYTTCGSTVQGMSVGWGDTYGSHLAGQSVDVTNLPDGDYSLSIVADPKGRLLESNEGNNTSCVLIRLRVTTSTVQVLNPNNCSANTVIVNSISPNGIRRGLSNQPVTIRGSGFAQGMTVSFEGGSGQRPTVSAVQVISSTEIRATVTVPRKAKVGGLWDVRVGSGVLLRGFQVLQ